MKIDVKIKMLKQVDVDLLPLGATASVTIDLDYLRDFDDVINEVEIELYEKYGVSLYYEDHFEITNPEEIDDRLEQLADVD